MKPLINDRQTLHEHAQKVIDALDDDLDMENIFMVLVFAMSAVLITLSKSKKQLRAAPAMVASVLKEMLKDEIS